MSFHTRIYLALILAATFVLNPLVALAQEDSEGGAAEVGPPWTYQMAKITVVMVLFLGLAIGGIYYRLVVRRRRGEA